MFREVAEDMKEARLNRREEPFIKALLLFARSIEPA
jgi:hypothetical protein